MWDMIGTVIFVRHDDLSKFVSVAWKHSNTFTIAIESHLKQYTWIVVIKSKKKKQKLKKQNL